MKGHRYKKIAKNNASLANQSNIYMGSLMVNISLPY